ncbi:cell envelope biogenesis protein OmpA [Spirochaetia bacterium]|nr:cell envelope biogenesis protein OmpA [Spirochaetia bacterium]GHU32450.1 cell envelope biogenesis protein OmpA [Spirochaetia bacterium]
MQWILCIFFVVCSGYAQEDPVILTLGESGPYSLVERSNFSRFDNGVYIGHLYREVRALLSSEPAADTQLYRGNFYIMEETLRDMTQSARSVSAVIPVYFEIHSNGHLTIDEDRGFPALRGFPTVPEKALAPGSRWTAPGDRAVDPLDTGVATIIPFTAGYEYKGIELYQNIPIHRIKSRYTIRYTGALKLTGTHDVDILLRVADGSLLFMRDVLDETFSFPDASTRRLRGFTLTFGQGSVPLDRDSTVIILEKIVEEPRPEKELPPDIAVVTIPEGIKLIIQDLQFMPDLDRILPAERPRLDAISEALKQIPDRIFLVEGHTAGSSDGIKLSTQRAQRVVEEMVARGIPADRFLYKGWGNTRPVADNDTTAGRARNRRVEITILD